MLAMPQIEKETNVTFLSDNIDVLLNKRVISEKELSFIYKLPDITEDHSNLIVLNHAKHPTISEIAHALNMSSDETLNITDQLLEKGILNEFLNRPELKRFNRKTSKRSIYINPEVFYKGEVDQVDALLCSLTRNFDKLKQYADLPYKAYLPRDCYLGGVYPVEFIENYLKNM